MGAGARAPALVEVVREVCGIHAQVMGSAELQLAARVDGITQADIREALWERRELAKTWTLRGTLHIHPSEGQKVTFVHPEDWLGPQPRWEPQEALREVARRYAETYGPVGHRQFREWFTSRSLTADAARAALCRAGARRAGAGPCRRSIRAPAPRVRRLRDGLPRA